MERLTPREIVRLANLARLAVESPEAPALAEDVSTILDHFQVLSAVAAEGYVEPIDTATPARTDTPHTSAVADRVLAAAPRTQARHFLVPKVIE